MNIDDDIIFPTYWCLYFHNPDDYSNWSLESYKKICEIRKLSHLQFIMNLFKDVNFQSGMFFLMRENIPPIWEDDVNIHGGYWSYIIPFNTVNNAWTEISIQLMTEKILPTHIHSANGISISPKKEFCILKVWNTTKAIGQNVSCNLNGTFLENTKSNFILFEQKKNFK